MELTQKLRHIFISDLEKCSPLMEEDLKGLLTNSTIPYLEGKDETDVRAFCFEYDHEDLTISFWALGEKSEIKRTSDDGEPSGTAGIPMLGVLESHQLTNLCVVVTRYFGGIKLGAGGLIRAYAGSVALAVKEIGLVEIKEQVGLRLQLSYSQYQEYANFLKSENLMEFDTEFTDSVATTIFVNKEDQNRIEEGLIEFFNGKVQLSNQGIRQVEVPIIS